MGADPLGGKLFALIQQKCAPLVPQFASQNISNFLIAAVLLGKPLAPPLLEGLARQAVLQMPRASPQGVANLLWAFAKLTDESPLGGDLFRSGVSTALEVGFLGPRLCPLIGRVTKWYGGKDRLICEM